MIDYEILINISGIWTQFYPNTNECFFIKKEEKDSIFERTTIDGAMKFFKAEYDTLKTLSASNNYLDIRISYNSDLIVVGYLDLLGKWNDYEKICELEVMANDSYKEVVENWSTKYKMNVDDILCRAYRIGYPDITANLAIKGARKLEDVITYIVGQINSAILFDEDSWTPFTMGDNWRKIYIASFADALSGDSTDYELQETELSMQDIFTFLNRANIHWYIENIAGNDYFRLKHISTISKSVGVAPIYDLSTYKSVNWSLMHNNFEWLKDSRFYRKRRNCLGNYSDFRGVDILIPSLENTAVINEEDYSSFSADIYDMYLDLNRTDRKYPVGSDGNWFIGVADENLGTYAEYQIDDITHDASFTVSEASLPNNFTVILNNDTDEQPVYVENDGTPQYLSAKIIVKFTISEVIGYDMPESITFKGIYMTPEAGYDVTTPGTYELEFSVDQYRVDTGFQFYITGSTGNRFKVTADQFTGNNFYSTEWLKGIQAVSILDAGILTPYRWNMNMSMSYIDSVYGAYDLPDSPAIINEVSTAVTIKRQKQLGAISFPCNNPNDIDFNYLIDLGFANMEAKELKIPFDKGLATITGLIY